MKTRRKTRMLSLVLCLLLVLTSSTAYAAQEPITNYTVDNEGFPMTVRAFLTNYQNQLEGEQTAELLKDGDSVPPTEYVATGQVLMTLGPDGSTVARQNMIVLGDVLGTGEAGLTQVVRLARAFAGTEPLEGIWLAAGDLNGSGAIDLTDLIIAQQQVDALLTADRHEIDEKSVDCYFASPESLSQVKLVFVDGQNDIPYVDMEFVVSTCEALYGNKLTVTAQNGVYLLEKASSGTFAEINFYDGTILFSDYDEFFQQPFQSTILDPTRDSSFITRPEGSFQRYGYGVLVDVKNRGIDIFYQDGMGYMPMQTFADIFLTKARIQLLYNGEACFIVGSGQLGGLAELYYAATPQQRSQELVQFNYDEFCLALDMFYGLKDQHDIEYFDTLFTQTGLKVSFLSPDAFEADEAIANLTYGYLGDLHSALTSPSWYAGGDAVIVPKDISLSVEESVRSMARYGEARARFYPDGVPTYEEVGNTAIVTFDAFTLQAGADYADRPLTPDSSDTIDILRYAHSRIMREDSPIENVVIDLSNNEGGSVDAALVVVSWCLGTAVLNVNSTMTGAMASTKYIADINQDGDFDDNDTVSSKRLFCLTSPRSFSCGNLVPASLKASGKVTMIGRASGGGACAVQPISTADGTLLQISGPIRLSMLMNGSYYDIDRGVDVDVPIINIDNFYNRSVLCEYLNRLVR